MSLSHNLYSHRLALIIIIGNYALKVLQFFLINKFRQNDASCVTFNCVFIHLLSAFHFGSYQATFLTYLQQCCNNLKLFRSSHFTHLCKFPHSSNWIRNKMWISCHNYCYRDEFNGKKFFFMHY